MANNYVFHDSLPVAPLKLAALESCMDLATRVNDHIVSFRRNDIEELLRRKEDLNYRGYDVDSYLLDLKCPRFGSGEAKAVINESVRGADIFAMVDVTNYSLTYNVSGFTNHMSPDDHFQDLKRVIGSSVATAHRVNVIMPFLYEGRQHKRTKRESLDCAMALEELVNMGVSNIITFDAHDPRVQNSIPLSGFDNFMPTYQFVKTLLKHDPDLQLDKDHLMVISPDEGAMDRAVYLANNLSVDMGMFYKRRDYSTVINGRNPIVAHEFLGASVEGKTVLIIDDMISSGESMLDTAKALKDRKAKKVIICCTFGLFTNGLEKFDEFYNKGYIDYVITTNLNYRPKELMEREWYLEANMSKYLAAIVNSFNHDISIGAALSPTIKIQKLLQKFHAGKTYYLPGIGINLERFHAGDVETIQQKRQELGLQPEEVFLLSVGELSDRKNHVVVIEAMKQLVQRHSQLRYFICGQGEKKQELQQLIRKYHLEDHVKLLGFRTDVAELCQAADVFVFPSKQEGLPVALMEAMACGVPVVCSRIRGNTDLVKNGENGYLVNADQPEEYIQAIEKLLQIWKNTEEVRQMRKNNRARIKQYSLQKINKIMENIYR